MNNKISDKNNKSGIYKIIYRLFLSILCFFTFTYISEFIFDYISPPDFSLATDTSRIVRGTDGGILRVFPTKDGQIRLKNKEIPELYRKMLLAYEDRNFYRHSGVDYLAIVRASWQNLRGQRRVSGASTITMQVAKMLKPRKRTLSAKFIEIFRARQIERFKSKDEILAIYAQLAPMGGNRQGIETAAVFYFGKNPEDLSAAELAWLIALPQSPRRHRRPENASSAIERILNAASEQGVLSPNELQLSLQKNVLPNPRNFPNLAFHLTQKNPDKASDIHSEIQRKFEQELASWNKNSPIPVTYAAILLENATGKIRAYVGNAADLNDKERKGGIDMLRALRSPGSTLKPFIYLAAMDRYSWRATSKIDDTPIRFGVWQPENYDHQFLGKISLEEALVRSRNTPAVRLVDIYGSGEFALWLQQRGLPLQFPKKTSANAAVILGGVGIRSRDLALIYRNLAVCAWQKLPEKQKADFDGDLELSEFSDVVEDEISQSQEGGGLQLENLQDFAKARNCREITRILRKVGNVKFGEEKLALKTGTSYGWRDLWLAGYSEKYTLILWRGRADNGFAGQLESAETLLPLYRRLFSFIPNPPEIDAKLPEDKYLPHSVQTMAVKKNKTDVQKMQIIEPRNGTEIEKNGKTALSLRLIRGSAPYQWFLNEKLIAQTDSKELFLDDIDLGYYRLTVIDQDGLSSQIHFSVIDRNKEEGKSVELISD
ncbi:MAG: transglycosylase domain-containing protein [Cardiobacteriaceae bacterium]|nr:transglycosylase domain-containing protein [Cardiobacteriaceae bacterium]